MSTTICLMASTLNYPEGGGHMWVYLNWALGLKANGCDVIWLERLGRSTPRSKAENYAANLRSRLHRYGLGDALAALPGGDEHRGIPCVSELATVAERSDLLINLQYDLPAEVVGAFRRSALLDIDPGLLQIWMSSGQIRVAPHDVYFTTGETVGREGSIIPDCGIRWHHAPPCVSLEHWPVVQTVAGAPFTTVSHWYANEWISAGGEVYANDKRAGFLPFLSLPRLVDQPLELALCLGQDVTERDALLRHGWRVRESAEVSSTPDAYQQYIQRSAGEFSCVKPSCVRLQNAWISDRTLCYLASGKPAVVQHTGPSRFLPDNFGLVRFHTLEEAAAALNSVTSDYARHCRRARDLAEAHFDAKRVVRRLLDVALL